MRWRLVTVTIKWVAVGVAAAFAMLWLASVFVVANWSRLPSSNHLVEFELYGGRLHYYENFLYLPGWMKPAPSHEIRLKRMPLAWGFEYKDEPWQQKQLFGTINPDPLLRPLPRGAEFTHPAWMVRTVRLPLWPVILAIVLGAVPLWFIDVRARRRELKGRCTHCGYDRRGLAPDSKCPECGTVPTK